MVATWVPPTAMHGGYLDAAASAPSTAVTWVKLAVTGVWQRRVRALLGPTALEASTALRTVLLRHCPLGSRGLAAALTSASSGRGTDAPGQPSSGWLIW